MSYTMTMDLPAKATEYVERRGPRFRARLQSLVLAYVTVEMQSEVSKDARPSSRSNGDAIFSALRECPVDVNFGQLIAKRSNCGRLHPVDFDELFPEDA